MALAATSAWKPGSSTPRWWRSFAANRRDDPMSHLSAREREVLALMAESRSNARESAGPDGTGRHARPASALGRRLWVTEGTVEKHVRSILGKLRLTGDTDDHRRVLAVLTFLGSRQSAQRGCPQAGRSVSPRQ